MGLIQNGLTKFLCTFRIALTIYNHYTLSNGQCKEISSTSLLRWHLDSYDNKR